MTLYQFKALDEDEQYITLWKKGIFIADRRDGRYTFALYQIIAFYVEVKYDTDTNKILGLRSFLNTTQLEPYLKDIKLPPFN